MHNLIELEVGKIIINTNMNISSYCWICRIIIGQTRTFFQQSLCNSITVARRLVAETIRNHNAVP